MRADLDRLNRGKDYGHETIEKIFKSDLYMQKKTQGFHTGNKALYVPITSDRGLCGGINSTIIREMKQAISHYPKRSDLGLFVIGDKGNSAFARPFHDLILLGIHEILNPINYLTVASIAQKIDSVTVDFDKIIICYNEYQSAISYNLKKLELMTRKKFLEHLSFQKLYRQSRPDKASSNPSLYDLYISSNLYCAMLNNLASEQSARMNAMENASKNAKELVEKLQLQYNKARQAKITMELVEIISGASAV